MDMSEFYRPITHEKLLECHRRNSEQGDVNFVALMAWGKKMAAVPIIDEPPPPPTPTGGGSSPVAVTPNDGVTRNFGPVYAKTMYATEAGGDGDFSWSVSGGNGYFKTTVNGTVVIDGGMTPFPVKKGDKLVLWIETPANGGTGTYSLMKYGS
jgi:hypothetical protein